METQRGNIYAGSNEYGGKCAISGGIAARATTTSCEATTSVPWCEAADTASVVFAIPERRSHRNSILSVAFLIFCNQWIDNLRCSAPNHSSSALTGDRSCCNPFYGSHDA